jgi:hypothetical protein
VQTGAEASAADSSSDGNLPATAADHQPKATFGGFISGIINFLTLSARFLALAAAAMWLKENLHLLKQRMHNDAAFARKVGEMCGAARADAYFVGLFLETATAFERVAEASGELARAADDMEINARGVGEAHEIEYRGVYEVRQASPYEQPTPGFNKVR